MTESHESRERINQACALAARGDFQGAMAVMKAPKAQTWGTRCADCDKTTCGADCPGVAN